MTNLGYLFYKKYYIYAPNEQNKMGVNVGVNNTLVDYECVDIHESLNSGNNSFELKTIYPGLVLGTGYMHSAYAEDEIKLGFFFDYTTGQPVILGSSVKGLLRSVFPSYNKDLTPKALTSKKNNFESRFAYVKGILDKLTKNLDEEGIRKLELAIFDGIEFDKDGKEVNKAIHERDIFFDAYITSTGNKILGTDYITPHKSKKNGVPDEFCNPDPLKMLKVLPDVTFKFQFDLKETVIGDCKVTPEDKLALFKQILLDFGIGAKTNVGFGKFVIA